MNLHITETYFGEALKSALCRSRCRRRFSSVVNYCGDIRVVFFVEEVLLYIFVAIKSRILKTEKKVARHASSDKHEE